MTAIDKNDSCGKMTGSVLHNDLNRLHETQNEK